MTSAVLASNLFQLEHEIQWMLRDWEEGWSTSPDERDYVLAAVEIFYPRCWPSEKIIERTAHEVYETLCASDGSYDTLKKLAELVFRTLEYCIDLTLAAAV